jgi:hypothetical protein
MERCSDWRPVFRFALAWLSPIALITCAENHAAPPAASPNEVLAEMSRRSDVPETELKQWLTKCDADQQAMYFCAFLDFVAVDLQLDRMAAEQARRHPECTEPIHQRLGDLKEQRNRACAKSAEEDYGAGSMAKTATAICASSTTRQLIDSGAALDHCPSGQSHSD